MKINKTVFIASIMLVSLQVHAQLNSLTGSPYSLFGLGTQTNANIGKYNGLGRTGVALKTDIAINLMNPASFGGIRPNLFLFDIGLSGELNNLTDRVSNDERRISLNFSNIAFAFPINKRSGLGIALLPSSSVGYVLAGLEEPVENSTETFSSNIVGIGGVNDIRLTYGYAFNSKTSIGARFSYLWGKIDEEEIIRFDGDGLLIEDENFYSGAQWGIGFQYSPIEKIRFGGTIDFNAILFADKTRTITNTVDLQPTIVQLDQEEDTTDFELPLTYSLGTSYLWNRSLSLTLDVKQSLWGATDQEDTIGRFVDQTVIGAGAEYIPNTVGLYYWQRINFRAGINYDSGYLQVDDNKIDNLSGTLGLGLPVGRKGNMLNLSFTRGRRGQLEGVLVQENLNQFNINLSLNDLWFQKVRFN